MPSMTHALPEAFFMKGARDACFCLFHPPPVGQPARGALLYIHPFAEEMNLSRRMAAAQARAFASAGYAVLQIDLHGCGDSAGDFAEADWDIWRGDVVLARTWLAARVAGPQWLWGLRCGCLLAAEVARQLAPASAHLLFWQPVFSGQQHLNQFLRLSLAAAMARGVRGISTAQLLQTLAQGEPVEVAGYGLSPLLAAGLARATLADLPAGARVVCLEMSPTSEPALSPALVAQLAHWRALGCQATATAIAGAAFWQLAESSPCPALLAASVAALAATPQETV